MPNREKILKEFEKVYQQQKDQECEELHNRFADILNEIKPSIQNVLFVFELMQFELLSEKFREILKSREQPK